LVIDGQRMLTDSWIESTNPAQKDEVVGRVARGDLARAEAALVAAERAFGEWSRFPAEERARVLLRIASRLRKHKLDLAATMIREIGKTWVEAEADIAEAIDFCEFYAREMLRLAAPQPVTTLRGNENELVYLPLGPGVAIPPWNFPGAIATGLVVSAVVAGNTMIFKPASLTPIIAAKIFRLFEEAGLPPGVVNYLPGPGESVGDYLVAHPRMRFVSFTGSKEVGIRIWEEAAKVRPGQKWLKRVIAEMGGKDAIIVDESADLDAAADGIVASAYGFQGQKCSACSRVIAVASVYETIVQRVAERANALRVGDPADPATNVGPVADPRQFAKVVSYLEVGRREARLVAGGTYDDTTGYFVDPTVFADVAPTSRLATEEIFGPVLSILKADDFDAALAIANATEYGLTGGVYARAPYKLARARREFHVGNLYLNRKITGALVGVEPFGGFNMSGTDAKAGGRDHLLQFLQAKSISERL
ncbi:MAG TPA: L-glutamate gamma-semialdehyde dehydrogenase, partial [Chloroflexota bacterium]|nr:L-glutamate gamma-semialdehyde dehydrogenase [Chloroflexota bacterium]